jgi:hypothetical protein
VAINSSALQRHKSLNAITKTLSPHAWHSWKRHSKLLHFDRNPSTSIAKKYPAHLIFPTSAIFSYSSESLDGGFAESSLTGNEGVVGLWMLAGKPYRSVHFNLQTAGFGILVQAEFLNKEIDLSSTFRLAVLNHANAIVRYATQTCLCYRYHTIEQQVAKTILLTSRRTGQIELDTTHQTIGAILGIRREGVSGALKHLQKLKLIEQKRGKIMILQPTALEAEACECYPLLCKHLGYNQDIATLAQD